MGFMQAFLIDLRNHDKKCGSKVFYLSITMLFLTAGWQFSLHTLFGSTEYAGPTLRAPALDNRLSLQPFYISMVRKP